MNFKDLKSKEDWIIFNTLYGDLKIKKHLTTQEQLTIITSVLDIVLGDTIVAGVVNDKKLINKYLMVYYAFYATDINFTDEDKKDTVAIINTLENLEFDKLFYETEEYMYLFDWACELAAQAQKYNTTFSGVVNSLIEMLPDLLNSFEEFAKNLDNDYLKELTNRTNNDGGQILN